MRGFGLPDVACTLPVHHTTLPFVVASVWVPFSSLPPLHSHFNPLHCLLRCCFRFLHNPSFPCRRMPHFMHAFACLFRSRPYALGRCSPPSPPGMNPYMPFSVMLYDIVSALPVYYAATPFVIVSAFGSLNRCSHAELLLQYIDALNQWSWWERSALCTGLTVLCLLIVIGGAHIFAKATNLIFVVIGVSLVCVFGFLLFQGANPATGVTGWLWETFRDNAWSHYDDDYDYLYTFGIMLPAFTNILAGINMSGDLKNPSRDIPRGLHDRMKAVCGGKTGALLPLLCLSEWMCLTGILSRLVIKTHGPFTARRDSHQGIE